MCQMSGADCAGGAYTMLVYVCTFIYYIHMLHYKVKHRCNHFIAPAPLYRLGTHVYKAWNSETLE